MAKAARIQLDGPLRRSKRQRGQDPDAPGAGVAPYRLDIRQRGQKPDSPKAVAAPHRLSKRQRGLEPDHPLDPDIHLRTSAKVTSSRSKPKKPVEKHTCTACADEFIETRMVQCPCDHLYCTPCLRVMFLNATKPEAGATGMFPPRCCKVEIPLPAIGKGFLSSVDRTKYRRKHEELTGTDDKHYCSNRKCGEFIPGHFVNLDKKSARCTRCREFTCTDCGKPVLHHFFGNKCPEDGDDVDLQLLQSVINKSMWTRCGRCKMIVEKRDGCNSIVCKCGNHFCYVCGIPGRLMYVNGQNHRCVRKVVQFVASES
ncbi:hypothetical protein BJ508DRAFT_150564 [Ascobolus immersus RN42]|uniref:RING-type domain-containing protein n=1 Tax=Ascobolus immersus RN42 TaxID=1160509 RepID=A0A3N4I0G6_ASCIM|nr:hypothetical protein BJ508DRAFT_150564 [Ascobolus immersus RN42]